MVRGEIRLVDFGQPRGAEVGGRRPAVIVSNDGVNTMAARFGRRLVVTVVPVTSDVERVHPFQVLLPAGVTGLPHDSKAQAEQIRAVAVEHVGGRLGALTAPLADQVDEALRLHLAL